jgi:hypothetical protein
MNLTTTTDAVTRDVEDVRVGSYVAFESRDMSGLFEGTVTAADAATFTVRLYGTDHEIGVRRDAAVDLLTYTSGI